MLRLTYLMILKHMKKIKFLSLLMVASLFLSACGKEKVNEGMDINEKNIQTEVSEKKSLKELLSLGTAQKCTFEVEQEGQTTKGEILIKGNKFKQGVEIPSENGLMKVYSISDGEYLYSWNDAIKGAGSKIKIETMEITPEEDTQKQENINWEEKLDYKCNLATLSEADLALPTDIEFVDLSEMVNNLQNMSPEELKKLVPGEE